MSLPVGGRHDSQHNDTWHKDTQQMDFVVILSMSNNQHKHNFHIMIKCCAIAMMPSVPFLTLYWMSFC